jgi:hypothetical protein
MKPNDLRVGNWVLHALAYKKIDDGFLINVAQEFEPIPITNELLEILGFEYNKYYQNFRIKAGDYFNSIKYFEGEWCYNNCESDAGCYFVTTVQYVHELQNLYFAINKEELKDESTRSDSDKQN